MKLRHSKRRLAWFAWAGLALLGFSLAWSGQSQAASCSITNNPDPANIDTGESVSWYAATRRGFPRRGTWHYSWTLNGSSTVPADARTQDGVYDSVGTFETRLTVTRSGTSATCTAEVQVAGAATPLLPPPSVTEEDNSGLLGRDQGTHVVLGANDLGMHCADQDDSIFSVLPPFNVLHAQVIRRGGTPSILNGSQVEVTYSAASNPYDPVGSDSINSTSANWPVGGTLGLAVYKGNFWDPNPVLPNYPQGFLTYEPLFFGLLNPGDVVTDLGLPAPETIELQGCLADTDPLTACNFEQQAMPGILDPYYANDAQPMHFDRDFGFFNDLLGAPDSIPGVVGQPLGGVINNVNWFRADGIPILPVDDSGRGNAYPLVRVLAKEGGVAVASTDVVLPVAAEADCQNCHVDPGDCDIAAQAGAPLDPANCIGTAVGTTEFDVQYINDADTPGGTIEQKLLNAAKINILRVHDAKHPLSPTLDQTRNVVCARCHYTPALDLAQLGPQNLGETQQVGNVSMSRAMHGHHGLLDTNGKSPGQPGYNGASLLFPDMPPPDLRSPGDQQGILMQTCYQCHPGKRTQCLRGAMGGAGIVCQDCHGNMAQVGNDFTGGGPRVSWASEPKCQSCHTGDARNKNHPANAIVADDDIRLLQAYTTDQHSNSGGDALPILSPNSRFAENETLYRLSGNDDGSGKGHGGIMCEGCHGSTHAIWPNANPDANDNVAAGQLQGHTGTVIECGTCHTNVDSLSPNGSLSSLRGPHGLHAVGNTNFARSRHKEEWSTTSRNECRACHGQDGRGTVLSRMATGRTLECKDEKGDVCNNDGSAFFEKGHMVGCDDCHENMINKN